MKKLNLFFIVGTATAMTSLVACKPSESNGHAGHGTSTRSDSPVVREYQEVNDRMHEDMVIAFTGDADVDFMRGMIPHHQGAIDMARVVLKHGKDPEVKKLAETVIIVQQSEIGMMKKWLSDRGQ